MASDRPQPQPDEMRLGRELFRARTAGGDAVTFVCYDDGYALRSNGRPLPRSWWPAGEVDDALDAFRNVTQFALTRPKAIPAA